ncbi:hypothetical protein Tco_0490631 [Tanacetum coccineum]
MDCLVHGLDLELDFIMNWDSGFLREYASKCLSGKTTSNDRLRQSRVAIIWGMVKQDCTSIMLNDWEDFSYQIDNRQLKKRIQLEKTFKNIDEQILDAMLPDDIKQICDISGCYQKLHRLDTLKKTRGNGHKARRLLRVIKKKVSISDKDNIIPEPDVALELAKSMSLTEAVEEEAARQVHTTYERIVIESDPEPTRRIPSGVSNESTVIPATSSKGTGTKPGVLDKEKVTFEAKANLYSYEDKEKKDNDDDDKSIDIEEADDEQTIDEFVRDIFRTLKDSADAEINSLLDIHLTDISLRVICPRGERFSRVQAVGTTYQHSFTSLKRSKIPSLYDDILDLSQCKQTLLMRSRITLPKFLPKEVSDFANLVIQSTVKKALEKTPTALAQSSSKRSIFLKQQRSLLHQPLYDALFNSLYLDDVIARGQADLEKILRKRDRDDKDPSTGPKREEPVEEPAVEMASDDIKQTIDDVVNDVDQPPYDTTQTKDKALKYDWFKQPLRPLTPNPEWNTHRQAHLVGPVYTFLKGTCQSSIELEYNIEECYKALTNQLDCNNPEGDRCPYDLSKPLPLKVRPGRLTVPLEYFFNNDLEYLKASDLEKKYTTSITKTKAAKIRKFEVWLVLVKDWGDLRLINKLHGYGHLEEIVMRRVDRQKYKLKEGDFVNLHLNDIEDMLLLVAQHKLFNLEGSEIVDLDFLEISAKELYTPSFDPLRAVYEDLNKQKRVMRADELYKFSDGTLKLVHDELHHKIIRNLERLVGAQELEMDYRLMQRTA